MPQVESTLALADLQDALRAAFPGAVLVPAWVLREIIAHDRSGRAGLLAPRQSTYGIERSRLKQLARSERLPLGDIPDVPWLALLPRPDSNWLASTPAPLALRQHWRLLFQARVHGAVRQTHPSNAVFEHVERLGAALMHEIRLVLHEERLLAAGADDVEVYAAFVAVFMEFFFFDPPMLRRFFPAISSPARIVEMIGKPIDADGLLREAHLAGSAGLPDAAEDPADAGAPDDSASAAAPELAHDGRHGTGPAERRAGGAEAMQRQATLLASAERAGAVGNDVRAALLHTRAFNLGGARAGVSQAGRDLDALAERLASTPEIGGASATEWRIALRPLLAPAARGWWNREARLLYDLQTVCVDNEREVYSVNLVEWALDLARGPLRKPLPRQGLVLIVKHLRSAEGSLARVPISAPARAKLARLLSDAAHAAELKLHVQLYPVVLSALRAGGLQPGCNVEAVALNKLVEELLDTIARKGFISLGDLRDAVSRNAIKLDDLRGAGEFFRGDQLLRMNRKLAVELDGVYRPGEIYLRLFQRLSSLFFAGHVGRIVFWTVLMPFGGAYLLLEGLQHTVGLVCDLIFKVHLDLGAGVHFLTPGTTSIGWKAPGLRFWVDHPLRYLAVAALFFVLANWPALRALVLRTLLQACRALHWLCIGLPGRVASLPVVRAIVESRPLRLGLRYIAKPLALAGLTWLVLPKGLDGIVRAVSGGVAFIAANLLLNSRHARALEGALIHKLRTGWEKLTGNILAGLYRMVMGFFEQVLEDIDRMLYQVDEWLRFRAGQGRGALLAKALLGVGWFYIAYLARFVINLLIEPQLNPIKHFPVVTVSAKILIPQMPHIMDALESLGLAHATARLISASIMIGVPGVFGFLAWELLSNWKLYKANRPPTLGPVPVGSHGESLARLLRPGIHSGTIPKVFARLRRAAGRGSPRRTQKQLHALEHAREAVEHFLDRELIVRLSRHPAWQATPVTLGRVELTPTSIVAELLCAASGEGAPDTHAARISFRCYSGWIVAGIEEIGWVAGLRADPLKAALLSLAIAGLYKLAGVDLVREHVDEAVREALGLGAGDQMGRSPRWDVRPDALVVWVDGRQQIDVEYELGEGVLHPRVARVERDREESANGNPPPANDATLPVLDSRGLMLCQVSIAWQAWAKAWEPGATLEMCQAALARTRVLPSMLGRFSHRRSGISTSRDREGADSPTR